MKKFYGYKNILPLHSKIEGQILSIDLSEYYLRDVDEILGILASGIFSEFNFKSFRYVGFICDF